MRGTHFTIKPNQQLMEYLTLRLLAFRNQFIMFSSNYFKNIRKKKILILLIIPTYGNFPPYLSIKNTIVYNEQIFQKYHKLNMH